MDRRCVGCDATPSAGAAFSLDQHVEFARESDGEHRHVAERLDHLDPLVAGGGHRNEVPGAGECGDGVEVTAVQRRGSVSPDEVLGPHSADVLGFVEDDQRHRCDVLQSTEQHRLARPRRTVDDDGAATVDPVETARAFEHFERLDRRRRRTSEDDSPL